MQPVKPLTRIVALALVPFLVIGATLLYVCPDDTERLFAWSIKPELKLGIVRPQDDVHTDRTSTWIYLGAELALFALLASLIVTMSRRRNT